AHHAERRRTREQDLADQLKELDVKTQVTEPEEEIVVEELSPEAAIAAAIAAEAQVEGK
ncbi:MAG: hypothetical protein HOM16_04705, partial [Woeseia sp.]|nr:hypothetical protein [Woeseia sp.]